MQPNPTLTGFQVVLQHYYFSIRKVPSSFSMMVSPSFTVTNLSPVSTDSIENPMQKYGARTLSPQRRLTSS